MKGFYTILLLIVSNVFMTFAWYGHLKMKQEYSWFAALPLIGVIAFSWAIAFFEYSVRYRPIALAYRQWRPVFMMQLKVIQEVITLLFLQCSLPSSLKVRLYIGIIWLHLFV